MRTYLRTAVSVLLAFTATACNESTGPGAPAALELLEGADQTATVGTVPENRIAVRVRDARGLPIRGEIVTWTIASGGGTIMTADTRTDVLGIAEVSWRLGTTVGANSLVATVAGLPLISIAATATAGAPAAITLTRDSVVLLLVGDTAHFGASVADAFGNPLNAATVTWSSSNESIATVNGQGVVTVTGRGTATIIVRANTAATTARVRIPLIGSVVVTPDSAAVASVGDTVAFTATVRDEAGALLAVPAVWRSLDASIATVTADGRVVSRANGVARIVATGDTRADTVRLRVTQVPVSVSVTAPATRFAVGDTASFPASVVDARGSAVAGHTLTWTSSDQLVATVNSSGRITALAIGSTTIRATSGALTGSAVANVAVVFNRIDAGANFTCGSGPAGSTVSAAYCWGANGSGQFGNGTTDDANVPQLADGDLRLVTTGGVHACGLDEDGALFCWGGNAQGQLGTGGNTASSIPLLIDAGRTYVTLAAGRTHTCGIAQDSLAYCWGSNALGQIGAAATATCSGGDCNLLGVPVDGGLKFRAIDAGLAHTCAVTYTNAVYCWGSNSSGQLGDGTTTSRAAPVLVTLPAAASIAVGDQHTCAILLAGTTRCWGRNDVGQLGDGTTVERTSPVAVQGGGLFSRIAAGGRHTCGTIASGGLTYCWGASDYGQGGAGSVSPNPVTTPTLTGGSHVFNRLTAGGDHTCGVLANGDVFCWGRGREGQLGDGFAFDRALPTRSNY